MPQLVAPRPQGLDSNQLKARLYAKSEVHTSSRPVLKVVRRRPRRDEVGTPRPPSSEAIHALLAGAYGLMLVYTQASVHKTGACMYFGHQFITVCMRLL